MRITRPLIGTAVGAGVLGASLAMGLTMASASSSASAPAARSHLSATSSPAASSPAPGRTGTKHRCPNMGSGGSAASMPGGM